MGQSTEELTADIERTRENLSRGVDELGDKVSPSRIMLRKTDAAKSRFSAARDHVMGTASATKDTAASAGSSVGDMAGDVASAVQSSGQQAVQAVESGTTGNPLTAGLIAFGAGVLISSAIPASKPEKEMAQRAVDTAKEHGKPIMDEAKSVGQQMGQELKDHAAESAQELKESAQESMETVKSEGQSATRTVKDEARPNG
jgi:gas vesicle protein